MRRHVSYPLWDLNPYFHREKAASLTPRRRGLFSKKWLFKISKTRKLKRSLFKPSKRLQTPRSKFS